jgi:hypothetical protein
VPSASHWPCAHQSQNKFLNSRVFVAFPGTPLCISLVFQLIPKLRYFLSVSNPNTTVCAEHRVSIQQLVHAFLLKKHIEFYSTISFITAFTEVESLVSGLLTLCCFIDSCQHFLNPNRVHTGYYAPTTDGFPCRYVL